MKQQLVELNTARLEAIERGEQVVVGVNKYLETEPSPLTGGVESIMAVSEGAERDQLERLKAWRAQRDNKAVADALAELKRAATTGSNIMPPSIACAKAGVTTGEWGWTLRESFGEYRAPTGVGRAMRNDVEGLDDIRADVDRVSRKLGRRLTFLVGKPGPRRPFQRRRADRGPRARRRHAGGLRGHPPDAGGNRRGRARAKGTRHRALGAVGQPPAVGAGRGRRA